MSVHADAIVLRQPRAEQIYTLTGGPTVRAGGFFVQASSIVGDFAMLFVIALCIPLVIVTVGLPIALLIRGLLWIAGWL